MAYGLKPVQGSGTGYGYNTGGFSEFKMADDYAGNVFAGDFVELLTTGYVQRQNTTTGESPIIANPTLGVAVGFSWVDATGSPNWGQYYPGGTATVIRAFVCSDPGQIYMIQGDEAMDQSDIGATFFVAGFAASAGSTATGNSGIYLDSSTTAATAKTLRCLAIPSDGANENSTTPNVVVQLLSGVSQFGMTTGI
jgi:hypothetical protein